MIRQQQEAAGRQFIRATSCNAIEAAADKTAKAAQDAFKEGRGFGGFHAAEY